MTRTSKAAKMAKEMLVADRRAKQRLHRARTAHKVPLIRPEMIAASCQPLAVSEAAAAQRQSGGPVARHTCRAPGAPARARHARTKSRARYSSFPRRRGTIRAKEREGNQPCKKSLLKLTRSA